jgi:hypothetical protein
MATLYIDSDYGILQVEPVAGSPVCRQKKTEIRYLPYLTGQLAQPAKPANLKPAKEDFLISRVKIIES